MEGRFAVERKKLTVWVPQNLFEGAQRYASENDTALTRLITEYLSQLTTQNDPLASAPIVQLLSGTRSQDVSVVAAHCLTTLFCLLAKDQSTETRRVTLTKLPDS